MTAQPTRLPESTPRPRVKVCGLRRAGDALLALELGASFLGLIFAEGTPRCLSEEQAASLLEEVRAKAEAPVRPVGVFVHEPADRILHLSRRLGLAAVQLHAPVPDGELAPLGIPVVRAVRIKGPESSPDIETALEKGPVLLDAFAEGRHGGTGKVFDHALAVPFIPKGTVLIAGGLNPGNIGGIAETLKNARALPYAFDVSSGLEESPGVKSAEKMRAFFAALEEAL